MIIHARFFITKKIGSLHLSFYYICKYLKINFLANEHNEQFLLRPGKPNLQFSAGGF